MSGAEKRQCIHLHKRISILPVYMQVCNDLADLSGLRFRGGLPRLDFTGGYLELDCRVQSGTLCSLFASQMHPYMTVHVCNALYPKVRA